MTVIGTPENWVGLIDPMVPDILNLVISTWECLTSPPPDEREDNITIALCRALRQNRTARELMFQIDTQQVEIEPALGQEMGRLDIAFRPLIPREDIYFCLETKRLNVITNDRTRAYAAEYVNFGMLRFITGQYAKLVRHGGMLAYVLDGNISRAMHNVEANIKTQHSDLGMDSTAEFRASSIVREDSRVRETHHHRTHQPGEFHIHHLFMPCTIFSTNPPTTLDPVQARTT